MLKLNIAVVFGGASSEHEVSVNSARQVINSLNKEKYNIIPIAITKSGKWLIGDKGEKYLEIDQCVTDKEDGIINEITKKLITIKPIERDIINFTEWGSEKIDLVLPIGHGTNMEDGRIQGMLDLLGIHYVFSGHLASALAMNKYKTKLIAKHSGLDVLDDILIIKGQKYNEDAIISKLGLPVVVKPNEMGSSVGISIVRTRKKIIGALEKAFEYGSEVLIEKYLKGRELTVAVIGNNPPKALPVIEIIPKISEFFDYNAKYKKGGSEEICPADIPKNIERRTKRYSEKIFKAIGCSDLARTDFMWDEVSDKIYFLEINTIPGMTATSLAPQAAKAADMNFTAFLDKLIDEALKRKNLYS